MSSARRSPVLGCQGGPVPSTFTLRPGKGDVRGLGSRRGHNVGPPGVPITGLSSRCEGSAEPGVPPLSRPAAGSGFAVPRAPSPVRAGLGIAPPAGPAPRASAQGTRGERGGAAGSSFRFPNSRHVAGRWDAGSFSSSSAAFHLTNSTLPSLNSGCDPPRRSHLAEDAGRVVSGARAGGVVYIRLPRLTFPLSRVCQIPGGFSEDSCVLRGIMVNKDVTHPRMRRLIKNPRIVLLDCSLEYKKGESQTDIEITREEDFARILQMEEEYIQQICEDLMRVKPDLVITEKGISDLAQHYLMKANISAIRRVRKTDNNRIARACGARIVSRTDELREEDVGTGARLFEVKKIGDEYFAFITDCKDPKACTIVLRGASKEILAEVERNLQDAMQVCRNVLIDPQLVPGGGATEMAVAHALTEKSKGMTGVEQWPYRAVAQALEVIPRTLIQNCGASTIRVLTSLRAKHTQEGSQTWGVNGETGALADMKDLGIWEPLAVKLQTYKTAVETAVLLLRIDDIVSGHKKKGEEHSKQPPAPEAAQE
ncbi:T-complex protein 1 subunit gamma-like [Rhynochetos jubatus]